MVEHVTAHVCREHFPISSLTAPALDTLLHLLESPPSCCNARRLHSAYRNRPAAPSLAPPSHSLLQRDPFFPTFPLALPPDVYHSPPLSVALAATATSEKTLALQRRARPLVRRLPPTSATCSPHPTLPPHMSTHPCPFCPSQRLLRSWGVDTYLHARLCMPFRVPGVRHQRPHFPPWREPPFCLHPR